MKDELNSKIEKAFKRTFLGDSVDFSDEEISEVYKEAGFIFQGETIRPCDYKLIAFVLVSLTKEWDRDESAWRNFIARRLLGSREMSTKMYNQICKCIDGLGASGDLLTLEQADKKYYSTMCCHAFAPKDSVFSLFEVCWKVYFDDFGGQYDNHEFLSKLVARSLANHFKVGVADDVGIKIGTQVYAFRTGIKRLALERNDLLAGLVDIVFTSINALERNVPLGKPDSYFKRLFHEWWGKKQNELGYFRERTVGQRQNIVFDYSLLRCYFILDGVDAKLIVPSFRLETDTYAEPDIDVFVSGNLVIKQQKIPIFSGSGLFPRTKMMEYPLEKFDFGKGIDIQCRISYCDKLIYDSKRTLLRTFIVFSPEGKELKGPSIPPGAYSLFAPNGIDGFLNRPSDITRVQARSRLFRFNALEGEAIRDGGDIVLFYKDDAPRSVYFLCQKLNLIYRKDGKEYEVIDGDLKLVISEGEDVGNIWIRYNDIVFPLSQFERDGRDFTVSSLTDFGETSTIAVFRMSDNHIYDSINFIKLGDVRLSFDKDIYYEAGEAWHGEVAASYADVRLRSEFTIYDEEFSFPLNGGELLFKPPLLRWKLDGGEWQYKPMGPIYYREIGNTAVLKLDMLPNSDFCVALTSANKAMESVIGNPNEFKIGQAIHALSDEKGHDEVSLFIRFGSQSFELIRFCLKPKFAFDPLFIDSNRFEIGWNPETYIGDECDFELRIFEDGKMVAERPLPKEKSKLFFAGELEEGHYEAKVVGKTRQIFLSHENELYSATFHFGDPKTLQFKGVALQLTGAKLFDGAMVDLHPYYIDHIRFLKTTGDGIDLYSGRMFLFKNGEREYADKVNPVRFDFKTSTTMYLFFGLDENDPDCECEGEFTLFDRPGKGILLQASNGRSIDYYVFRKIKKMED